MVMSLYPTAFRQNVTICIFDLFVLDGPLPDLITLPFWDLPVHFVRKSRCVRHIW